ncbi:MAG: methyltransferase domain-containing protein [Clostridiales bacterium]|nr:methyltransferase domain-containing protein [Clostridiales bacterium]
MFILCYSLPLKDVDGVIEKLQINDIYDVFYESPLEITTDENGYGYIEKEDEPTTLKVAYNGEFESLKEFNNKIQPLIGTKCFNIYEENETYDDFSIPAINIDDNWVLASPDDEIPEGKKKINFISQGAFGTGLHETTQDLLKIILEKDFSNKSILDIGTGSGILSIAAAIKNASNVTAVDIRDVEDEVMLNASLNNLNNINVLVGNILTKDIEIKEKFDWIFINIGGLETEMFIDFIKDHLKENGRVLVSGLVEWSFDKVKNFIENNNLKLCKKYQTNEWCTAIFSN